MMIVEFLWYLGSTVHDTNGWEISLALSLEERDILWCERERERERERDCVWVSPYCSCDA